MNECSAPVLPSRRRTDAVLSLMAAYDVTTADVACALGVDGEALALALEEGWPDIVDAEGVDALEVMLDEAACRDRGADLFDDDEFLADSDALVQALHEAAMRRVVRVVADARSAYRKGAAATTEALDAMRRAIDLAAAASALRGED